MTQEKVQNAKIAMASVEDPVHQLQEYDGNFHTLLTLLTVSNNPKLAMIHDNQHHTTFYS